MSDVFLSCWVAKKNPTLFDARVTWDILKPIFVFTYQSFLLKVYEMEVTYTVWIEEVLIKLMLLLQGTSGIGDATIRTEK